MGSGGVMRLYEKTLIIIGVVTTAFLAITLLQSVRSSFFILTIFALTASLISFGLIYTFVVKRIEKLNNEIQTQNKISVSGNDEINSIANTVNKLVEKSQSASHQFEQRLDERTRELQKMNDQLRHDIEAHKFTVQKAKDEHKDDRSTLAKIARYDNLTSLPNRVFFNEILNKSIAHAKRHKKNIAVLVIDLDDFKKITKELGFEKSEIVLKEIGKRFSNSIRVEDVLSKFDGDSFGVIISDLPKPKFASMVAEKLLTVCAHPLKIDDHEFKITASIGICVYPNDGYSLETLLTSADEALYKAKHNGGNQFQFYAKELDIEAREYIQLDSALRKALHNNEITLSYQPKIHLKNGNISSLEVLMRWEHPVLGIIPPSKFITIAEDNNTIMTIGEWAIREACQTNKLWQDQGYEHFTIAVKLSPKQFYHPDIIKTISNILTKSGLDPRYLEIEIAEKTVMDNAEEAIKILKAFKELGIQLSMDHFGVGYTSIKYLKQFPISNIKIDRLFISGLPNNPDDCAITSAIIALAHVLGIEVVAEGVETADQVEFLASQGCDMVQGYFLSHPLPAQKIVLQFAKLSEEVLV